MPLIEEVLLGGAVGALIQAIFLAKEKATFFKKTLEHLQSTLQAVGPIMEQIVKSEQVHGDVCRRFIQQLENARVLVNMYSDIKMWKLLKKRKVKKLIEQMDATLCRFLTQDFQAEQLLYLTNIDKDVTEINKKMDHIIALLEGNKGTHPAAQDEISSSPQDNTSDDKQYSDGAENKQSPAFELRWKMSKDKCLDIRFWRSCED